MLLYICPPACLSVRFSSNFNLSCLVTKGTVVIITLLPPDCKHSQTTFQVDLDLVTKDNSRRARRFTTTPSSELKP